MMMFVLVAAVLAVLFAIAFLQRPHPARLLAVALWGLYAVYEYFVANGTLCDPGCNIRVDLVLFLPILAIASVLALQKEPRTGPAAILTIVCLVLASSLALLFGQKMVAVPACIAAVAVLALWVRSRRTGEKV